MKSGRSGHLIRTIILLVAVVAAFIVVSAAIRYNRKSGLFDAHTKNPEKHDPSLKTGKQGRLDLNLPTSTEREKAGKGQKKGQERVKKLVLRSAEWR